MTWTSIQDIIDEFDLDVSDVDPTKTIAALRHQRDANHPTSTGGEFADEKQKNMFARLNAATDWVKAQPTNNSLAMIPVDQPPAPINLIPALQRPSYYDEKVGTLIRDTRSIAKRSSELSYRFPRISSGAIATITGFLAAFPEKFMKIFTPNAELALYSTNLEQIVSLCFFTAAMLAGMIFCLTWLSEKWDEELTESAMSSDARTELFRELIHRIDQDSSKTTFSSQEFVEIVKDHLLDHCNFRFPYDVYVQFWRHRISPVIAEKIAFVHLEELEYCGAIRRVQTNGLYQMFAVTPDVAADVS